MLNRIEKYGAAEELLRDTLEVERRVLGREHPDTLYALGGLAQALCEQGKYAEAETNFKEFDDTAGKALPENSPILLISRGHYGHCLARMDRFEQAERLLLDTLSALETSLGKGNDRTRVVIDYVITLYEAWGKPEQAAEYRARLEEAQEPK